MHSAGFFGAGGARARDVGVAVCEGAHCGTSTADERRVGRFVDVGRSEPPPGVSHAWLLGWQGVGQSGNSVGEARVGGMAAVWMRLACAVAVRLRCACAVPV
eukprot:4762136-Alexandrium_andersonii.AAC.1